MQFNSTHYGTIRFNSTEYNTIQYVSMQYDKARHNTKQYNTTQQYTIEQNTTEQTKTRQNTIQYSTHEVAHNYITHQMCHVTRMSSRQLRNFKPNEHGHVRRVRVRRQRTWVAPRDANGKSPDPQFEHERT